MKKTNIKNDDIKHYSFKLLNLIILTFVTILIGFLLIIIAYGAFKPDYSSKQFEQTSKLIKKEASYYTFTEYDNSIVDTYTDSLMILIAMHPVQSGDSFVDAAMKNTRFQYKDPNTTFTEDVTKCDTVDYSRYWHGYLVLLRPLLCFFNLGQIRTLNAMAQGALLVFLIFLLIKKNYKFLIIPLLISYAFMSPFTIANCFQYSNVWYLILIGSILYLVFQKKIIEHHLHFLFFTLFGMLTSYLDLLTYPVAVLGFLLIIIISTEKLTFWESVKRIISCGFAWFFGYIVMWLAKIFIATLILNDNNVIEEAKEAFIIRKATVNTEGKDITDYVLYSKIFKLFSSNINEKVDGKTVRDTFEVMFGKFMGSPIVSNMIKTSFLFGVLSFAWTFIKHKVSFVKDKFSKFFSKTNEDNDTSDLEDFKTINNEKARIAMCIGFKLLVIASLAMIAILWYNLVRQHSFVHAFFTYRTLSISFFAIMLLPFKLSYDLDRHFSRK